jgi:hypothetical protein
MIPPAWAEGGVVYRFCNFPPRRRGVTLLYIAMATGLLLPVYAWPLVTVVRWVVAQL